LLAVSLQNTRKSQCIAAFVPILSSSCESCKENNRERCYHWRAGDENSIEHFQAELRGKLEEYLSSSGMHFDHVVSHTKIIYNPSAVNRAGDKSNIDFDPSNQDNSDLDCIFFHSLVNSELMLRRLPNYGTLEDKRRRLKPYLMMEQQIRRIQDAIWRTDEGREAALILISQADPCIMHLENRVGEKLIALLLYLGALRYQQARRSSNLKGYAERIESIVQKQILGTPIRPNTWRFPLSDDGKEVSFF